LPRSGRWQAVFPDTVASQLEAGVRGTTPVRMSFMTVQHRHQRSLSLTLEMFQITAQLARPIQGPFHIEHGDSAR
jgi:hypothetical protein